MTPEEILQGLYDETLVGNAPRVLELTNEALALGMEPQSLLFDALIPSLEEVGARFERGDFFVPEMLIAGRAMAGAMAVLRPLLAETGVETGVCQVEDRRRVADEGLVVEALEDLLRGHAAPSARGL